jgi:hypothetical protein
MVVKQLGMEGGANLIEYVLVAYYSSYVRKLD